MLSLTKENEGINSLRWDSFVMVHWWFTGDFHFFRYANDEGHGDLVVNILVDAMDESNSERRDEIVLSLLKLASHGHGTPMTFEVLVASCPTLVSKFDERKGIDMRLEGETADDIEVCVGG